MGRFKPIKQFRISEEVLSQLKESILLGKFKSGEKLPSEKELTEEFLVSRGVVREAIRALEITGFVELRQGPAGGAFVTDLSFEHVGNAFLDLFLANKVSIPELADVRFYIEPEVAYLAAVNANDEDKKRLITAQKDEFVTPKSTKDRIIRNQKVHHLIAESSQNHFYEAISKSMLRLTFQVVEAVSPDHEDLHQPGEHKHIIDAILDSDAEAARSAMKTHMKKFCKGLVKMETAYRQRHK